MVGLDCINAVFTFLKPSNEIVISLFFSTCMMNPAPKVLMPIEKIEMKYLVVIHVQFYDDLLQIFCGNEDSVEIGIIPWGCGLYNLILLRNYYDSFFVKCVFLKNEDKCGQTKRITIGW